MNFLRGTCLLLTITLVSLAAPAFAQQDVDPDHFDHVASTKPVAKAPISKSTAQKRLQGKASAANHRAKSQSSKRSVAKLEELGPGAKAFPTAATKQSCPMPGSCSDGQVMPGVETSTTLPIATSGK